LGFTWGGDHSGGSPGVNVAIFAGFPDLTGLWIDSGALRRYAIDVFFPPGFLMVARLLSFSRTQPVAVSAAAIAVGGILTILGA
jgi:hypothetical protein